MQAKPQATHPASQTKPNPRKRKSRPKDGLFPLKSEKTYFALASATAVSNMRFEKPHSLSYQLDTFTRRPDTLVSVASNVDEAGLWLKSIETSGAELYPRMPFSAPSDASFMIAFTSSTVVSRLAMNDRSTIDTLMFGARIASPSSLPFRSGSTKPTTHVAPL